MENLQDFMNEQTVLKDDVYNTIKDSLICPICKDLIISPMMCMNCQNSFCKKCIEKWTIRDKKCPNRCQYPNYRKSLTISQLLSKIKIVCIKCNSTIEYDEMIKHIYSKCGTENNDIVLYKINRAKSVQGIFEKVKEKKKKLIEPEKKIKSKIIIFNIIMFYLFL